MDRQQALDMVNENLKNENLFKHVLATEAIMAALAERLGQDKEKWSLAGLLHDIDYEKTADSPEQHGIIGAQMLEAAGLDQSIINAVKAHNDALGFERKSLMDKALYAADPITGLIVAAALVKPSKRLSDVDVKFVKKKMKEKSFARGASRDQIKSCSELGIDLDEFIELSINSMCSISNDLGL